MISVLHPISRARGYDALRRQVWDGHDSDGVEVVRTFVKRLRRRLGDDAANPVYIHTERGGLQDAKTRRGVNAP